MSVVSVRPKDFILALFIRDDGERFLLGDNGYDFKDSQLHFVANTIENDEVVKQGADGVMLAGQVRRSAVQSFDGFVGDGTTPKETIEQMRRAFFAFFVRGHHFRVIYIDTARDAWQRKGGYLVDAPEIKELYQIHPEYHVGLNFEDVNYYSYDEDADGNEILANLLDIPVSTAVAGGLVWDEDGAVSEDAEVEYDTETAGATGKAISISDAAEAPLASFRLDGETSQNGTPTPSAPVAVQTVTGENVVKICGKNLLSDAINTTATNSGTTSTIQSTTWTIIKSGTGGISAAARTDYFPINLASGDSITFSSTPVSGSFSGGTTFPQIIVYWYDANKTQLGYTTTASTSQDITAQSYSKTYTASSNVAYFRVGEYIPGATTGTTAEVVLHLQLELGSTATTYEPYQGQSYEVNLGKNLFDGSSADMTVARLNSSGNITTGINNRLCTKGYIKVEPNTKYTFNATPATSGKTLQSYMVGYETSGSDTGIGNYPANAWYSYPITFTTGSNCHYIRISYRYSDDSDMATTSAQNQQLEKGSTATTYAPYFTPIELCKIGDYQDYIYKDGSDWKIHKAVGKQIVDTSTITLRSTYTNIEYGILQKPNDFIGYHNYNHYDCYCSHATPAANPPSWDNAGLAGHIYDTAYDLGYWVGFAKGTGLDNIKAALSGCIIYYIFTTPTDTEITNQALIAQLNALLTTARTYVGINNIFTITPNEQGTLEVGYYTKYQPIVTGGGYVWEAGGSGGPTTVINNSIDNVSPIWTIYGPTQNPQLENTTTGETIEYVGVIADGQTLVVDMGEQTASLDGLNVISNLVGDFIQLAPGANRLIYTVTGDAGASQIGWSEIVG